MTFSKLTPKLAFVALSVLAIAVITFNRIVGTPQQGEGDSGTATLSWSAPVKNEDDSPLIDLVGYVIYYSTDENNLSEKIYITDPNTTTYTVSNLGPGTYYFSISARETNGNESSLSNVISKSVP